MLRDSFPYQDLYYIMQADTAALAQAVEAPQDEVQQARDWWGARELDVEREQALILQRRMEAQRAQLHAFKTEQSKWEHELQLRISKYAHDRKLLSEQNVELQEELTIMEEKLAQHQSEMNIQVQHVIELEGMLRENQIDALQMRKLQDKNEELQHRLRQWERIYRDEKLNFVREQKTQQDELLNELERLLAKSEDKLVQREGEIESEDRTPEQAWQSTRRRKEVIDDDPLLMRIKELEAACKQKDQKICSLKEVVEQQETTFDEKMKIVTAKYDQVKAINLALQKRFVSNLTES